MTFTKLVAISPSLDCVVPLTRTNPLTVNSCGASKWKLQKLRNLLLLQAEQMERVIDIHVPQS